MKLWTSLLFLHGHIADPALARLLAGEDDAVAAADTNATEAASVQAARGDVQSACAPFKRGAITAACSIALSPFR